MDQFTMAEFAKNSENKEGSAFTPEVQEEGIEQGSLIVSRLYNTMLGEITRTLKSWNSELTKVITEAGLTPSALSNEQLFTAISKMVNSTSGHEIGETVTSIFPLTNAGLHLLDGSLISGDGVYAEFVEYMAELYESTSPAPSYFTTESAWQTSVSLYGVCSKFVYDAVNNTIRLPRLYSPERYLIKTYESGSQWCRVYSDGFCEQGGRFDTVSTPAYYTITLLKPYTDDTYSAQATISTTGNGYTEASAPIYFTVCNKTASSFQLRSSTYGNVSPKDWATFGYVDISTYANAPLYTYITLTQAPKTDIQIDVDNIVTELNNKVDKSDLAEVQVIVEEYNNGNSWYRIWSNGWCEQGGVYYAGSSIAGNNILTFLQPFSNTNYTVLAMPIHSTADASGYAIYEKYPARTVSETVLRFPSNLFGYAWYACGYIN